MIKEFISVPMPKFCRDFVFLTIFGIGSAIGPLCLSAQTSEAYRPGVVHVKVLAKYAEHCSVDGIDVKPFNEACLRQGVTAVRQKFPVSVNSTRSAPLTDNPVRIDLIYEVRFSPEKSPMKVAQALMRTGVCEYTEPAWIAQLAFVPSDQLVHRQWHLGVIRAYQAWDIDTGSRDIVIGVTDTGIDWMHEDLVDAIYYNVGDMIDGEDSDGNGYPDDYRGWNFMENNNDPMEKSFSHGTHVSGIACARTNNNIGVAGVGFSTRVLPVKCGTQNQIPFGYEGIVYAVNRGAHIVNCSWGSTIPTDYGHDIVRWATAQGVLIVAACGNNNDERLFFPAAFPDALSVAASDSAGRKADFSSFGYTIDVIAPGAMIYSTKNMVHEELGVVGDTYNFDNGTSMAAPMVAGAAALVLNRYPHYTPHQLRARLRATTSDFYAKRFNKGFINKCGTGLLDVRAALVDTVNYAVSLEGYKFADGDGDRAYNDGDTLTLGIELRNVFMPAGGIKATIRSVSERLIVLDSVREFPPLTTNSLINNYNQPFKILVDGFKQYNEQVSVQILIETDSGYTESFFAIARVNPDYVNVTVNNVATTFGSHGLFGYADNFGSMGLGFEVYNMGNFLFEGGLMIGQKQGDKVKVVDRIRSSDNGDRDFSPLKIISEYAPEADEAFLAQGIFTDTSAVEDEIGLKVYQTVRAWDEEGHGNYVLVEYTVKNMTAEDLSDVYVGLFADWDIKNEDHNGVKTNFPRRLGYVFAHDMEDACGGIEILSEEAPFIHHGLIHGDSTPGSINISSGGFSSEDKFRAMTTNRHEAAVEGGGRDVSHVVSTGPYTIRTQDSILVAFAIMGERGADKLLQAADAAHERYFGYPPGGNVFVPFQLRSINPNPASEKVGLIFDLQNDSKIFFTMQTVAGLHIPWSDDHFFSAGTNYLNLSLPEVPSGLYFLKLESGAFVRLIPVIIIRS